MTATVMIPKVKIEYDKINSFNILDFIVYASALWYFITEMTLGPIVRSFVSKRLWLCEMGRQIFFYNPEDGDNNRKNFEYKSNEKVKIQIDNDQLIKNGNEGEKSNVMIEYPRIFIDDNGIVLKNNHGPPRQYVSNAESERLLLNSQSQRSNYGNSPYKIEEDGCSSPLRSASGSHN